MSTCSLAGWTPPEKTRSDDGSLCAERVALLAKRHRIDPGDVPGLERVLKEIVEMYREGTPRRTVASREDILDLKKALTSAKRYLERGSVLARLYDHPGDDRPSEESADAIDRSVPAALVALIEDLLPVVSDATAKDGRAFAGAARRNAKARSAAQLLHDFWVKDLRRGRSVQDRGGVMSPGLRFILDCLHEFDDKVKVSTIRGFGSFKHGRGAAGAKNPYNSIP